jgi:hypothetical protein
MPVMGTVNSTSTMTQQAVASGTSHFFTQLALFPFMCKPPQVKSRALFNRMERLSTIFPQMSSADLNRTGAIPVTGVAHGCAR